MIGNIINTVGSLADTVGKIAAVPLDVAAEITGIKKTPMPMPKTTGKPNLTPSLELPKGFTECYVEKIINETSDTKTYRVRLINGENKDYIAGQFVNICLDIGNKSIKRSYTLSSNPSRPGAYDITVKRVTGGLVSNWMADNLIEGARFGISQPLGQFHLEKAQGEQIVMVSAGSGITPMMSILRELSDNGHTEPILFVHTAKTYQDIIFRDELETIASEMPNLELAFYLTREDSDSYSSEYNTGRIDSSIVDSLVSDLSGSYVFTCGPDDFMSGLKDGLIEAGLPSANFLQESFGTVPTKPKTQPKPKPDLKVETPVVPTLNGDPRIIDHGLDTDNVLVFAKSNLEIHNTNGATILELAEENNVEIDFSCTSGFCGICKIKKVSGQIKMDENSRDALSSEEEADGYILACNAKCNGKVVVEI